MTSNDRPARSHRQLLLAATLGLFAVGAFTQASSDCPWESRTPAPLARIEAGTLLIDGRIWVLGGFYNNFMFTTPRVDVYDPETDTWTSAADMPMALTHHGVAVDGDTIWVAGGFQGNNPGPVVDDVWTYDINTDQWSSGPDLPERRGSGTLVRVGRELHFISGVGPNKEIDQSDHWMLDLDNPTGWKSRAPHPDPRNHYSAAELDGKIYVIGGQHRHEQNPEELASVHRYDPASDTWEEVAAMPFPRSHAEPGTFAWNGRLIVAGGRSFELGSTALSDVIAYDPTVDSWSSLPPLAAGRNAPVVRIVDDTMVMTAGGTGQTTPVTETWVRPVSLTLPETTRIDCGEEGAPFAGPDGDWCSDHSYIGGTTYSNSNLSNICGTANDALYRNARTGTFQDPTTFGYRVSADPGLYRVRFYFAELYWGVPGGGTGSVGRRVFDVYLEDELVLDDFDINAVVGPAAAYEATFDLAVMDGSVDVLLVSTEHRPLLNALEVIRLDDEAFGNYCHSGPNSTGSVAQIGFSGSTSARAGNFRLEAVSAPPEEFGLFLMGSGMNSFPMGGGTLCLAPTIYRLGPPGLTDGAGRIARYVDFDIPEDSDIEILAGETWYFQLWYRDGADFNLSDALHATFTE